VYQTSTIRFICENCRPACKNSNTHIIHVFRCRHLQNSGMCFCHDPRPPIRISWRQKCERETNKRILDERHREHSNVLTKDIGKLNSNRSVQVFRRFFYLKHKWVTKLFNLEVSRIYSPPLIFTDILFNWFNLIVFELSELIKYT